MAALPGLPDRTEGPLRHDLRSRVRRRDHLAPRVLLCLAASLLLYTLVDILVWQRVFEANRLWQYADPYHVAYGSFLCVLILTGALTMPWRWALWFGAALGTLAFSGLEDLLYYWLDGRAVPAVLPWLDASPLVLFHPVTSSNLLLSAAVWVTLWASSLLVLARSR